jgi:hypothetical protein
MKANLVFLEIVGSQQCVWMIKAESQLEAYQSNEIKEKGKSYSVK